MLTILRRSRSAAGRGRLAAAVALAAIVLAGAPATAFAAETRVDLTVLVVTDGRSNVEAVTAQLRREGVRYDVIDTRLANRRTVTPALLATTTAGQDHARYQAVVVPDENALAEPERAALAAYEQKFGVRHLIAYTWAHPGVGLDYARWAGTVDAMPATVTDAGRVDGFGYLAGQVPFDDVSAGVAESYAALATPAPGAPFTPLVTVPVPGQPGTAGSVVGVHAHDGREEMVVTVSLNPDQTHARVLTHGIVEWLTRGAHLGYWRNWFSVHIDDVFLPDDRWHTGANCTVGDDCNPDRDPNTQPYNTPIRMVPADVDALLQWQRANGLKLDMAFNGHGSVEAGGNTEPLTAKLLGHKGELRWINHTYEHPYLGCVQDFSVSPWRCATDPVTGAVRWVSRAEIRSQISQNVTWAGQRGIALDRRELITGEHSGLRTLPQMPTDNPNLALAVGDTAVAYVASDASREPATRKLGPADTVPRHPMNIFYNVATRAEEVDEYNHIYTSRADGGSGICEANPATTTCIEPLQGAAAFDAYVVKVEARIALGHVVAGDPRPHYAHQSNLAEDRILYPVLDEMLRRYRSTYAASCPLVNPGMAEVANQLRRTQVWADASKDVEAYVSGGRLTVVNRAKERLSVPVSAPAGTAVVALSVLGAEVVAGAYGQAYGTGSSAWTALNPGGRLTLRLPG